MYLPSRLQKYAGIGRVVSAVIAFALSKDSSVRLTQMLRVPLNGLMKAMNLPSGEICAPEISGSPKNTSRSIKGGGPFCRATSRGDDATSSILAQANREATRTDLRRRFREKLANIIGTSFRWLIGLGLWKNKKLITSWLEGKFQQAAGKPIQHTTPRDPK